MEHRINATTRSQYQVSSMPSGKAQNPKPTALTPAREAGTWNCLEHEQGHWSDERVMN